MSISFSNLVVVQLTISDNCKFYCRSTLVQDVFESPGRSSIRAPVDRVPWRLAVNLLQSW